MNKQKAIIIDIDGTLANCAHRRHFAEAKDWKGFYDGMGDDLPNKWCCHLIDQMIPLYRIILVSGRPDDYRKITEAWLISNMIHYDDLFMRTAGDHRDDTIVKEEIYREEIEEKYNIEFIVDDRSKVVKMWRSIGLVCLQCDEGNF